jgi:hypothetical protein
MINGAKRVHRRGGFQTRPLRMPPAPDPCRHSDRSARGTSARSGGTSSNTAVLARVAPLHASRRIEMTRRVHTGWRFARRFLATLGMTAGAVGGGKGTRRVYTGRLCAGRFLATLGMTAGAVRGKGTQRVHTGRRFARRFLAALGMTAGAVGGGKGTQSVRGRRFARFAPLSPLILARHSDRRARGTSARSGGISPHTAVLARFAPLHASRRCTLRAGLEWRDACTRDGRVRGDSSLRSE